MRAAGTPSHGHRAGPSPRPQRKGFVMYDTNHTTDEACMSLSTSEARGRDARASWIREHIRDVIDGSVVPALASAYADYLDESGFRKDAGHLRMLEETFTLHELCERCESPDDIERLIREACDAYYNDDINVYSHEEMRYDERGKLTSASHDDLCNDFWNMVDTRDLACWLAELIEDDIRAFDVLGGDLLLIEMRHLLDLCACATPGVVTRETRCMNWCFLRLVTLLRAISKLFRE